MGLEDIEARQIRAEELARDIPDETIAFRKNVPSNQLCSLIAEHDLVLGIFGTTPKANIAPKRSLAAAQS